MKYMAADAKTMYDISLGIPNLRCFRQNLSIARLRALKSIPPVLYLTDKGGSEKNENSVTLVSF